MTYDGRISQFGVDAPDWARLKDGYYTSMRTYGDPPQSCSPTRSSSPFLADNGSIVALYQTWSNGYKTAFFNSSAASPLAWIANGQRSRSHRYLMTTSTCRSGGAQRKVHPNERVVGTNPVRITLVEQDVNRPDNVKRSDWKPRAGDEEKFDISEGATTVINVKEVQAARSKRY